MLIHQLKKSFELIKIGILIFAVMIFIRFLIDGFNISQLLSVIDIVFYLSIVNIAVALLYGIRTGIRTTSTQPIVIFLWFSFLKFIKVFEIFNDTSGYQYQNEYLTVISILTLMLLAVLIIKDIRSFANVKTNFRIPPYSMIALSFASIIFIGAVLLFMPISRNPGSPPLSLLNAVFTSTSAVCVTGLVVVDTGTYFSSFGQIVILILIQIGALGIMTFAAFFSYILGERMSFYGKLTAQNALNEIKISGTGHYIVGIISSTFIVEGIGAISLFPNFLKLYPLGKAIYYSVFHSVSAFCNAGFALYPDSLTLYQSNVWVNMTIMLLIIIGGSGFSVLINIINRTFRGRKKNLKLSLHSKIVISVSTALIFGGALLFFILEKNNLLSGMSTKDTLITSFFSSVTTRTAGFNTVDFGGANDSTLFFMSILMFIGASPGSTGGGIKTTTFLVIILTIFSTLREKTLVTIFKREISINIIRKALALFFLGLAWILIIVLIVSSLESFRLSQIAFEIVSAFGTVGLSTGITGELKPLSRILIITTMFLGRIGPLTLMSTLGFDKKKTNIRRPQEKILIG